MRRVSSGRKLTPINERVDNDDGSVHGARASKLSVSEESTAMKVVIFCGGMGLRLREYSENVPKPLVPIGDHPIMWHLMKYYAHYGHRDFILCLGHKAESIKKFFLNYNEAYSSDFALSDAGRNLNVFDTDFARWRI